MSAREYFEAGLPIVEDVISFHCFRSRLSLEEREDFRSFAIEKLIEDDYARLRKFEGRSTLRSFLGVTVGHLLIDYWQSKSGRRRPSSVASLFAPEGLWLERHLQDGYTVAEAVEMVKINHDSQLSRAELHQIALRLPLRRGRPKHVSESLGLQLGSNDASPERLVQVRSREASRSRLEEALQRAIEELHPDERVFVRMRFEDGSRINEIAKAFHVPEKVFYRRLQRTLRRLRKTLEKLGLDAGCLDLYRKDEEGANLGARAV